MSKMSRMKNWIWLLVVAAVAMPLFGCGEKVNTDIESVNKGKGEQTPVTPRDREGESGGR